MALTKRATPAIVQAMTRQELKQRATELIRELVTGDDTVDDFVKELREHLRSRQTRPAVKLIRDRYTSMSAAEIARIVGVSRERVRQILVDAGLRVSVMGEARGASFAPSKHKHPSNACTATLSKDGSLCRKHRAAGLDVCALHAKRVVPEAERCEEMTVARRRCRRQKMEGRSYCVFHMEQPAYPV